MQGWQGWDDYAPFYDWENARTMGRRDERFWVDLARRARGRVLELGCGTGRLAVPVAKVATEFVGVDRSVPMLARLQQRLRRVRTPVRASLVRADIRQLPFRRRTRFALVMAPYGMLQSLLTDDDLETTLDAAVRVLGRRGLLGIDLVPDLPRWPEYEREVGLEGRRQGADVTLIETVRQDRRRGVTVFDQEFVERRGSRRRVTRSSIAFRTVTVADVCERLERRGLRIQAVLGSYQGDPWTEEAGVWVILARKV